MTEKDKLEHILKDFPPDVKLIAVSKTKPIEEILKFYETGHKIFGENKVQEIVSKQAVMPKDIEWHFIGHLQRNKVKQIISFVHLIHGVDSFRLLQEIDNKAKQIDRQVQCLLQFHIASEETKFGLDEPEVKSILESDEFKLMENIRIKGVMGMATYTEDENLIRKEFANLKRIFDHMKKTYFLMDEEFCEISMGMSGDYKIAIEEGSTMVRIGSALFGERNY
ncbi:MAG: YggS family pyridoxal phosphate-dependent enzyme [Bacteroidales bacterium]|nr:YggS family pyridoxal phosphate-dependent enzyme [Bacteroidales bacterium]MCF8405926.1 YggS family pyridoxal phosphate-dependent enzyme [Bacteroidales bacterium]